MNQPTSHPPLAQGTLGQQAGHSLLTGVPEGLDALHLSQLARLACDDAGQPVPVLHVVRDDKRLLALRRALRFFAPDLKVIALPAWDCVPYDRVSPNPDISAERITALAKLLGLRKKPQPMVVLSTMNALLQRLPDEAYIRRSVLRLRPGQLVAMERVTAYLSAQGFTRASTVVERGDFAVRGGIIDFFPPAQPRPVRLDFFGDELESIRSFDPLSQRSTGQLARLTLLPAGEVPRDKAAVARFRRRYVELFGPVTGSDPLYEAISAGRVFQGMEHWLPLFHDRLVTLFDYLPSAQVSFDALAEDARRQRLEQIADHYQARREAREQAAFGAPPYHPVPPDSLFLTPKEWETQLAGRRVVYFAAPHMAVPPSEQRSDGLSVEALGGRPGRDFAPERAASGGNVFAAVVGHIDKAQAAGKRVLVACWSKGARDRLMRLLTEHGAKPLQPVAHWPDFLALPEKQVGAGVLGLEAGFETRDLVVISEQDILGDRLVRPKRKARRDADVFTEAASLSVGDLVVHSDHGIGRFEGLQSIDVLGAPHDCLLIVYHGGDKLFLPVENIELLSRYGGDAAEARLDRLGSAAWQARKARAKERIREIAHGLIKLAAMRELREAPRFTFEQSDYEAFAAGFPFEETEDQARAIEDVLADLDSGRPMDRLVCGDVGFGKTEVALRAAFACVMAGHQVAVVVPTTLLARQHFKTFAERFKGLPVKLRQASRLVSAKEMAATREGLAKGEVDIVVGTHALLGKNIKFARLGLLVIDEEQHFGVKHKEQLKKLRTDVHVLTLTATPIPRTLQMSLSGVRDLSLIATPPVDRLAVRSFVTPFDPVILREALLRERFRGGQSFYVCPRIADLPEVAEFLAEHVPELKVAEAHGQMPATRLDDIMTAFYERQYDVLLSTTIVESGLDVPTANTLIVHRADMFGLAQLYQLRGRVGRSKTRAYAYMTVPAGKRLTPAAEKRLKVLMSLDTLGAGFTLASHDLDIRGAGNLLGSEQSGHIREVGFELYQSMLEEAVASLKGGGAAEMEDQWSPEINIGTAVMIPESYVEDLQVRLGLYRRLSTLEEQADIEAFAAELADRFGPLPEEAEHLLAVVRIKQMCRRAGVAQIDVGPKGAVVRFRKDSFVNPSGLAQFITREGRRIKLTPDHRLVYKGKWETAQDRLAGTRYLVRKLLELASEKPAAA